MALWVMLTLLSNIAESSALFGDANVDTGYTQATTLSKLMHPEIINASNPQASVFGNIATYIGLIFGAILLYYPVIWQGAAIFVYLVFFLPVGIGFIWALLTIIRGVGSS
jgi:hypothetical protein